jgi:hypothetical protein
MFPAAEEAGESLPKIVDWVDLRLKIDCMGGEAKGFLVEEVVEVKMELFRRETSQKEINAEMCCQL